MTQHSPVPERHTKEPDLAGRSLGNYRVLRRLGRGAMAEVYLAEQTTLRRNIALKVLKRHLAADENYVRRFHMEAQSAAALVHANIVQIYEVGNDDGFHFIAQEYIAGKNLGEHLNKHGPLPIPTAVAVLCQVAAALIKAAEQGIVHRDIKPENIMLAPSGDVKVTDFGLARVIDHADGLKLTQAGVTLGTPLYMSPEQVEGRALDPRSDIYSLGVTSYQMLAGHTPFHGESALSVAVQHLQTAPVRLENVRPDLPEGLCRIVHRMLEKLPDDRYQNARGILRDLRDLAIEGLDEHWPQDLDAHTTQEIVAASHARHAATQQLEAVMRSDASLPAPLFRRRLVWLVLVGAFIIGGVLSLAARERPLLSESPPAATIEQMDGAQEQYLFALETRSEEAFLSVLRYFPDSVPYANYAKQELARLYLDDARFTEALGLFDEFANFGDSEPELRSFGLAGQYIVYSLRGESEAASAKLVELWPLRDRLDERMNRYFRTILEKSARNGGSQQEREIEEWLRDFDGTELPPPPAN